jgi:hypothetical protein
MKVSSGMKVPPLRSGSRGAPFLSMALTGPSWAPANGDVNGINVDPTLKSIAGGVGGGDVCK